MSDALDTFFGAWSETDAEARRALIDSAMAPQFSYIDPRTEGPITDLDRLDGYVAQFAASAPGWTATVDEVERTGADKVARVAFAGPDGQGGTMTQHGRYDVRINEEGRIAQISGVAEGQA